MEIRYSSAEQRHRAKLADSHPLGSFGSHLYADMSDGAHQVAARFMAENGFRLSNHINSWPEFQAIIVKEPAE